MEGSKWKAAALLTWILAAESAYGLPQVGTAVESILQKTSTEQTSAYVTQYPPANEGNRLLIPESHPVGPCGLIFSLLKNHVDDSRYIDSGCKETAGRLSFLFQSLT